MSRLPQIVPRVIATVGFAGYSPIAPGTAGSLVAALAFLPFDGYLPSPWSWFTAITLILAVVGVWSAGRMADQHHPDPSEVVIDEVVGMMVTLAYLPWSFISIGLGFLLFRVFDIIKPPPARQLERLPGGWGIVMDDVVAGIYANLALRLILFAFL